MRAFNPCRFEFNLKFPEGCLGQESDKDWRTQWLKHFDNEDGDNSSCINNVNNQIILAQFSEYAIFILAIRIRSFNILNINLFKKIDNLPSLKFY